MGTLRQACPFSVVAIRLEKYVSIKRTAERAVGDDRIPLDPGRGPPLVFTG